MEAQRGEVTCQHLKIGSLDAAVLSPSITAATFKLCFLRLMRKCAPKHVMNNFIGAGKDSFCGMEVEW